MRNIKKIALGIALGCLSFTVFSIELDNELDPVVVSANKFEQPLSDVLSSITVITKEEI